MANNYGEISFQLIVPKVTSNRHVTGAFHRLNAPVFSFGYLGTRALQRPVGYFDVAVATHKKIDLMFQTQVFKLKRGPRKRSAGSALSPTLRQNSAAEGIDETPADSSTTVCDGPSPARASATGNQDHSRTPGGTKCK